MAGEFEYEVRPRKQGEKTYYICVEVGLQHELAPWWETYTAAAELSLKATRGDQHVNRIPACPYGSPVPRPDGHVFVPSKKVPSHPKLGARVKGAE